jgi:hypothetical protein
MKPPLGVRILAVTIGGTGCIFVTIGVSALLGIAFADKVKAALPAPFNTRLSLVAGMFSVGWFSLWMGNGLWKLRPLARASLMFGLMGPLVISLVSLAAGIFCKCIRVSTLAFYGVVGFWSFLCILYLSSRDVRQAFRT